MNFVYFGWNGPASLTINLSGWKS